MKTLLEILSLSEDFLKQHQVVRSRREAEELLADVLGMGRLDLYLHFERPLSDDELGKMRMALKRRASGEPVHYIAGKVFFGGAEIHVTPAVLIPRPETELLVERVAKVLGQEELEGCTLWDLGCGSGCIGIALKKRFPSLTVILSDISASALSVAEGNARLNSVEVELREGDLFAPFKGEKCTYFVSNPPYVRDEEFLTLAREVRAEPKGALVSGPTGLEIYRRIASELKDHVEKRAWLEIGTGQGASVTQIFEEAGFGRCSVAPDWAGHDRFFYLENDSCTEVS